jgi:RHS repeat-associated protein
VHGSPASLAAYGERVSYEYDAWGRLARASGGGETWSYAYDDRTDLLTTVTNGVEGTIETREHDALGRLLSIRQVRADGTLLLRIDYTLAPDGNRLAALETRTVDAGGGGGATETVLWKYAYDALGRLAHEQRDAGNNGSFERDIAYTYDADSNRIAMDVTGGATADRTYVYYDGTQRLRYLKDGNGSLLEEHVWTANGELAEKIHNPNSASAWSEIYAWGEKSTLLSVTSVDKPGGDFQVLYNYNEAGELVGRKVLRELSASVVKIDSDERYLVDGGVNLTGYSQTLATLTSTDGGKKYSVARVNLWTDRLAGHVAYQGGAAPPIRAAYHNDPLGTVRSLTWGEGGAYNQTEHYDYEAFGTPLATETGDRSLTNYAFTGQMRDSETGLQYHRARWLNCLAGRWLSPDLISDFPTGFSAHYLYAASNPVDNTDKTGLLTLGEVAVVAAIAATLTHIAIGTYKGWKDGGFWGGVFAFGVSIIEIITYALMGLAVFMLLFIVTGSLVAAGIVLGILLLPFVYFGIKGQAQAAGEAVASDDAILATLECAALVFDIIAAATGYALAIKSAIPTRPGKVFGSLDGLTANERVFVQEQLDKGLNVEVIPKGAGKTPDFRIGGKQPGQGRVTELKTLDPGAPGPNTLKNEIENAARQDPEAIVVDVRKTNIGASDAYNQILRAEGNLRSQGKPSLKGKVTVITNEGVVRN